MVSDLNLTSVRKDRRCLLRIIPVDRARAVLPDARPRQVAAAGLEQIFEDISALTEMETT